MPPQSVPTKSEIDVTVMTLVTAITAALGAFAIFQPKLAVSARMKRETGSVEPAFRVLYGIPQYLNAIVIAGFCLMLFAAFLHSIKPDFFAQNHFLTNVAAFFVVSNVLWILFLAAVTAALVRCNWLCWLLLGAGAVASLLPVPRLRGRFGRNG